MKQKYPRGHFRKLLKEGKLKIEFASTEEISQYEEIAADFLERIFDMDRRDCLISQAFFPRRVCARVFRARYVLSFGVAIPRSYVLLRLHKHRTRDAPRGDSR